MWEITRYICNQSDNYVQLFVQLKVLSPYHLIEFVWMASWTNGKFDDVQQ